MNAQQKLNASLGLMVLLMGVVSALAYLPRLGESTLYRDDWYYILNRTVGGPGIFQEMFKIDRPARGPLFEAYYQLFGSNPLPYHLSAFAWRLLSGWASLWLFRLLLPGRQRLAFSAALLYTLYPGYLWWVSGIEYQPMILSAFLQVLSCALTLQALRSTRQSGQALAIAGSILTGWAYLALVDYAVGMEIFRLLGIFLLIKEKNAAEPLLQLVKIAFHRAWIFLIIPLGYLGWRLFIFNSQRVDTNLVVQVGRLLADPVHTGLWWVVHAVQSLLNVAFLAWGAPFYQAFAGLRLRDALTALALAIIGALCVYGYFTWQDRHAPAQSVPATGSQPPLLLGALGILFGVLPVIIANRWVEFENLSHYTLPASLGSALLAAGLLSSISQPGLRRASLGFLLAASVFTHFAAATRAVTEEQTIQNFWWQVYWRAPNIQPGAVIAASYPGISIGEDRDLIWGPANMIYYPAQTGIPARYVLTALATIPEILPEALSGSQHLYDYRSSYIEVNYSNLLVLSQPMEGGCVHALDSRWPRLSTADTALTHLLASRSRIENIQLAQPVPPPSPPIFGSEPAHTWCFYYQKAKLALQRGEWETIVALGDEAIQNGEYPIDRVEWLPFLQAYAHLGEEQRLREAAPRINEFPYLKLQACTTLQEMIKLGLAANSGIPSVVDELFCQG